MHPISIVNESTPATRSSVLVDYGESAFAGFYSIHLVVLKSFLIISAIVRLEISVTGEESIKAIGIDLAGVASRPTGICVMDGYLHASTSLVYTDDNIVWRTIEAKADVVAIDAPLALPRGRESLTKRNNIHLRECDRELLRMGIKFFPLTLGPMRQLTERGILLKAILEGKGLRVIETYPGAAQDILHIPRKRWGLDKLSEGLSLAGIKGVSNAMSSHELDAVTCALVGIMYLRGKHRTIGDPHEIVMILPQ